MNISSNCSTYRCIKNGFGYEKYLNEISPQCRTMFVKFRWRNDNLPVVKDRFLNIVYHNRTCKLCKSDKIGDEFHYLFQCHELRDERSNSFSHII